MPDQATNPYSPPAANLGAVPEPVIPFQGTLTRDDLLLTLRESPARASDRWRAVALALLALIVGGRGGLQVFQGIGDPVNATLMLVGGAYVAIFGWTLLIKPLFPYHRQRVQRVKTAAANQTAQSGWVDEQGVTICSEDSVLQARWATFAPAYLFPRQLMLPMVIDPGRRIPLPWRFFQSREALHEVEGLVKRHVGIRRRFRANLDQLRPSGHWETPLLQRPSSGRWEHGPWPETTAFSESFRVDLSKAVTSSRYFGMFLLNLLFILFCLAPIFVAILFWALCRYHQRGSWWALFDEPLELIITIGPPLAACGMLVIQFVAALQRARRFRSEPAGLTICDRYVHLSTATYQSWFRPASVHRVLVDQQAAGWVFAETLEEMKLPKACFAEGDFDRFCRSLRKLDPSTQA